MRTDVFELHFLLLPNVSKKQGGGVYLENSQTSKLKKWVLKMLLLDVLYKTLVNIHESL